MVFYGLSLNTGILYGDYYINFLIIVLVEFPGHALPFVMIDRLGRKRSHFIYMGVGGLACLSTIFTVNYGGQGRLVIIWKRQNHIHLVNTNVLKILEL